MNNTTINDRFLPLAVTMNNNIDHTAYPALPRKASGVFRKRESTTVRCEKKIDFFCNDLPDVLSSVEENLSEIARPHRSTATVHFHDPVSGAPAVDFGFRLRGYGDLDPIAPEMALLDRMSWQVERKSNKIKTLDGVLNSLAEARCADSGRYLINGTKRSANTLKIVERRHFALANRCDEFRRMTADICRSLYRFDGNDLAFLGEMGPRLEVKTPHEMALPGFLAGSEDLLHETLPFSSLYLYLQHVLRSRIRKDSFDHLGELELKFAVTQSRARDLLFPVLSWLTAHASTFRFLLPDPKYMCRMRRYHVGEGNDPGIAATIVETPAGRCSLKKKRNARSEGAALIRDTVASHNTDIDGQKTDAAAFAAAHGLRRINSFVKVQRKVPFHLQSGLAFQLSLDECRDRSGRVLQQMELEFIGDVTGRRPDLPVVLSAMAGLSAAFSSAPFAGALQPTDMSKHHFFAEAA